MSDACGFFILFFAVVHSTEQKTSGRRGHRGCLRLFLFLGDNNGLRKEGNLFQRHMFLF